MSVSFQRLATERATTKRLPPVGADGRRGAPQDYLPEFPCTPLDPVEEDVRLRLGLDTPHELLQTFAEGGLDIREGDILVYRGREYPIRAVGEWKWPPDGQNYLHLIVEDLKLEE